jgi:hypothetical protein
VNVLSRADELELELGDDDISDYIMKAAASSPQADGEMEGG